MTGGQTEARTRRPVERAQMPYQESAPLRRFATAGAASRYRITGTAERTCDDGYRAQTTGESAGNVASRGT